MTYDAGFYDMINTGSQSSARVVVPMILNLIQPATVIDIGCGQGAWTAVFIEHGCDAYGIDGDHIDRQRLLIPSDKFLGHDLAQPLPQPFTQPLGQSSYDLAVSLEVAEHLPEQRARSFVDDLCSYAPAVLFSAAIPGQGGVGHLNERWPGYWAEMFTAHGYHVSGALRWRLWDDDRVENWYRQNLLLCVSVGAPPSPALDTVMYGPLAPPWPVVHPVLHDHLRGLR